MKTLEILKTKKDEVIQQTIELLPEAVNNNGGMFTASLAFFIDKDGQVDYFNYTGQIYSSNSVFYKIPGHEVSQIDVENTSFFDEFSFHIESDIEDYLEHYNTIAG